jgi:hypothetical protein
MLPATMTTNASYNDGEDRRKAEILVKDPRQVGPNAYEEGSAETHEADKVRQEVESDGEKGVNSHDTDHPLPVQAGNEQRGKK